MEVYIMKRFIVLILLCFLSMPAGAYSATQAELEQKLQELNKQMEDLKKQVGSMKTQEMFQDKRVAAAEEKAADVENKWSWLTIGGEYRFRLDSLEGKVHDYVSTTGGVNSYTVKNDSVMTNRFRLKVNAKVYDNLSVKSRLSMYKVWGHGSMAPVQGSYFADRASGAFDGTAGYVPQDSVLRVDYAFATWSNIAETPVWFSIGRRYSTQGVPTNIRQNTEKIGTAGVAGHIIDYAFDGLTLGYAPEIEALPGAYAKFCYGRGYDSGFKSDAAGSSTPKDTDFVGLFIDPIDTDNLNVELQLVKAYNIFDNLPDATVSTNLGDVDNYGIYVSGKLENIGIGDLNLFASAAHSKTNPNENTYANGGQAGLLFGDDLMTPGLQGNVSKTGNSIYVGARYDIEKTGTKVGLEYNHGSKNWISFTPAADDLWTSKLGTRGSVVEGYVIQDLPGTPIAKFGKAFIRVGYQYYKFEYTGSNNWIGEPVKISDLNTTNALLTQMLAPIETAHDIYATLDITF
jgi:hypothetical protein